MPDSKKLTKKERELLQRIKDARAKKEEEERGESTRKNMGKGFMDSFVPDQPAKTTLHNSYRGK